MRKSRPPRWGVMLWSFVILIVVVWTWRIYVHDQRRLESHQQTREKAAQDAADRAAGIFPIEDLVKEEYE